MPLPTSRIVYLSLSITCVLLMAVALYMEHVMALEPCPLCILQRVMVIATGIIALFAALHGPGKTGIQVYGGLVAATATGGAMLSLRQLWLQSLPADEVPSCGPSLDYLLDVFPLTEVLTMILSGDGSCAEVAWSLFGISIPGWTLVGFIGLIVIGIWQISQPRIRHTR
jgi:disulfide bond formation protein DsbB